MHGSDDIQQDNERSPSGFSGETQERYTVRQNSSYNLRSKGGKIMTTPNGFYMIYVEGQNGPTRQHLTYHDAKKEAERLARLMHKKTYILGTIECLEVNDIISTKCNVSEIPF